MSGWFKNNTSAVLQHLQNEVSFQRKDAGILLEFLANFSKSWECFLLMREHLLSFRKCGENFDTMPEIETSSTLPSCMNIVFVMLR